MYYPDVLCYYSSMKKRKTFDKVVKSARSWAGRVIQTGEVVERQKGSQTDVKAFRYELRRDGSFEVFHDGISVGFQNVPAEDDNLPTQ